MPGEYLENEKSEGMVIFVEGKSLRSKAVAKLPLLRDVLVGGDGSDEAVSNHGHSLDVDETKRAIGTAYEVRALHVAVNDLLRVKTADEIADFVDRRVAVSFGGE